jgi:hypothetical protein
MWIEWTVCVHVEVEHNHGNSEYGPVILQRTLKCWNDGYLGNLWICFSRPNFDIYIWLKEEKVPLSHILCKLSKFLTVLLLYHSKKSLSILMLQLQKRTKKNHSSIIPFTCFCSTFPGMTVNVKIYFES